MSLTDNEIVKSLEICTGKRLLEDCPECPNYESESRCKVRLSEVALDLINRQKAEIERLNKEVDRLSECVLYHDGHIVDAIKEFVAEIEAELAGYELHFIEMQDWSARNTIRQVISAIKEMVGESNG
jgi:hypothetical protein